MRAIIPAERVGIDNEGAPPATHTGGCDVIETDPFVHVFAILDICPQEVRNFGLESAHYLKHTKLLLVIVTFINNFSQGIWKVRGEGGVL